MPNTLKLFLLVLVFLLVSAAYVWADNISKVSSTQTDPQNIIVIGGSLFQKFCADCHGKNGHGDGSNAEFLDKGPAELSSPEFLAKRSNDKLFRVISEGGAHVKKSHLMPMFGHTLSEKEIWFLIAYIRNLGEDEVMVAVPDDVKSKRPIRPALTRSDMAFFSKWFNEKGQKKKHVDNGKLLVMNKKSCLGCHQLNDEGGRIGPNLNRSSFNYKPEWIYAWISNPQIFRPNTKMPNPGLSQEEARAIAAFLVSFQPDKEDENEGEISSNWNQYLSAQGDPKRGEKIFNDPEGKANCAKCHLVKDQGGSVGPELSFVGTSRTREFLIESILDPDAVITSGYKTILILTKNRMFITGIKKNEDDSGFDIVDKEGRHLHIAKARIKKFKTQKISTMPGNFQELLKVQEVADLLAYLGTLTLPNLAASVP